MRYSTREFFEGRLFQQRNGGQIEQPTGHDAASPPHFRHIGERKVVPIILRIAEGRCLCIDFASSASSISVLQDVESLSIGGHQGVLDAVVHHFHEVPGSRRAAMQVALFRGSGDFLATGRARNITAPRRKRFEDWIEMLDDLLFAADHLAIAALETPDTTARPYVDVVQRFRVEFFRVASTTAAGPISHTARGVASFFTRSSSEVAAVAPSRAICFTDSALRSKATH